MARNCDDCKEPYWRVNKFHVWEVVVKYGKVFHQLIEKRVCLRCSKRYANRVINLIE